ncbi:LysR family transcriptional regulator [Zobellella endophytica]|nr:LysR substrate-binding domain-containing protein [Zobellella endophytica]
MNINNATLVKTRFSHLRLVLAIAHHGSVHKAADELHITQPAATRALKELESQLGSALFERSPQGMNLNIYGQHFAEHARVLLNQFNSALEQLNEIRTGSYGHINLAMQLAAAPNLLPLTISKIQRRHLNISLNIQEGSSQKLLNMLMEGHVDMIVGRLVPLPASSPLEQTPLFYDAFSIVCGPRNPLATRTDIELRELLDCKWIYPASTGSQLMGDVATAFKSHGLPLPEPMLEVTSLLTMRKTLQYTDMIGLLVNQAAKEEASQGQLNILPIKFDSVLTPIGITTRAKSELTPAINLVSQLIIDAAGEMLANPGFELVPA